MNLAGSEIQPESLPPQTSTPNVASPTEDCGEDAQKPRAQEGDSGPNSL